MDVKVNGKRLWQSLIDMARIGATPRGGVCRLSFTPEDREARDLFVRWCEEAGCKVRVDRFGNIFARRPGRESSRPVVMAGSHLDSQPTGGRFDGVYGVMAALEVVRTLNDHRIETECPVEVAAWTNEEGALFKPMIGSAVWLGMLSLEEGLSLREQDGSTVRDGLVRIGYLGDMEVNAYPVRCYFEAHIEQGPVLEQEGRRIGVVTGAQAQRWYGILLTGVEAHAGTTPMNVRNDAMVAASRVVLAFQHIGSRPDARATIGQVRVHPNSSNTIPGRVQLAGDLRHPDEGTLDGMDKEMRASCARISAETGVKIEIEERIHIPAVTFHPTLIGYVEEAAKRETGAYLRMVSGAGHDAVNIAKYYPTTMIFIPCRGGMSHNEDESALPEDCEMGCNVLCHAMLDAADRDDPL